MQEINNSLMRHFFREKEMIIETSDLSVYSNQSTKKMNANTAKLTNIAVLEIRLNHQVASRTTRTLSLVSLQKIW